MEVNRYAEQNSAWSVRSDVVGCGRHEPIGRAALGYDAMSFIL